MSKKNSKKKSRQLNNKMKKWEPYKNNKNKPEVEGRIVNKKRWACLID